MHIVFVTAYDQYAVEAFERAAVDYLLKPVGDERLAETVARLKARLAATRRRPELGAGAGGARAALPARRRRETPRVDPRVGAAHRCG